jgi:4a-hydroxytetrahydrobiopterin dehydratase
MLIASRCRPGAPRLSTEDIGVLLPELEHWSIDGHALVRTFAFANFHETMAFVNAVAFIAHREDHHPDLGVSYNRCSVRFSTHDAGGLTRNDFICAAKVGALTPAAAS